MFDDLSDRFGQVLKNLKGQGRLTDNNIKDTMSEVRKALLEADVALPVVQSFVETIRERAVGEEVLKSLTPGQVLIKIVHQELITIMGSACEDLNLAAAPPACVLVAGLQGSGKTTSIAKLARMLRERNKKKVLVVSCDVYRPAAIEQLQTLASEVDVTFFPSQTSQDPVAIATAAVDFGRKKFFDVVIVDTAGRLHVDDKMMSEIQSLHDAVKPVETLFVVDSMMGQDAANVAGAFNAALPLTGIILTKTDGDARGGAALSIRHITGKPIKFLGVGEKTTALEPFYPDRIASRILGMGDVLSLVEEVERNVDRSKAEKLAKKMQKGKIFDLDDFREQLMQLANLGGLSSVMDKIPGMANVPQAAVQQFGDREMSRMVAIVNSMTIQERRFPAILKASRKRRIAAGSGTTVQDINRLMKQFMQMQKMMKKASKGGLNRMMRGMQGKFPGGAMPF